MTLNDIIVSALGMLERGRDAQTIDTYRDQFTYYANLAVREISLKFKRTKKETVALTDKQFNMSALANECIRVEAVLDGEDKIDFYQDPPGSGEFVCDTESATVDVVYRYCPILLTSPTDEPDLPERAHRLIPIYIVACQRCGGDPNTQGTSAAHFALFQRGLSALERESRGEPSSFKLHNMW